MPDEPTALVGPSNVSADRVAEDAAETRRESLDGKLASGVAWLGGMRWLSQALAWATTVLVARQLDADAYGVLAAVMLVVGVASNLIEFGLARALMVRGVSAPLIQAQIHSLCIQAGIAFTAALVVLAPWLARAFTDDRLTSVLRVLAFAAVLNGLFSVPIVRLQLSLDYARIARVDFIRSIAQALTVLTAALCGAGYWSLVAGILATNLAALLLVAGQDWIQPALPRWKDIRTHVTYGWHLGAGMLLWHAYSQADRAVSAKIFDLAALGLYQFALSIAALPGEKITNVLQSVAAPFFGNLGGDVEAMRRYLLVMTETIALIVIPVLVGFVLVADVFIPLVFGSQWAGAVLPLQILVVAAVAQNLQALLNLVLNAAGRADVVKWASVVLLIVLPPLFWYFGRSFGIAGVASVWAIVLPLMMSVPLLFCRSLLGLRLRDYASTLMAPLTGCSVMVVVVLGMGLYAQSVLVPLRLALLIVSGAVAYSCTILLLFRPRVVLLGNVWLAGRRGHDAPVD